MKEEEEIPPYHIHQKKRMFSFISMRLRRVVMLYTSLRLIEGITNHNEFVLVEPVWQNRVSKRACEPNVPVSNFPKAPYNYMLACIVLWQNVLLPDNRHGWLGVKNKLYTDLSVAACIFSLTGSGRCVTGKSFVFPLVLFMAEGIESTTNKMSQSALERRHTNTTTKAVIPSVRVVWPNYITNYSYILIIAISGQCQYVYVPGNAVQLES